jgi:hypothetical protein
MTPSLRSGIAGPIEFSGDFAFSNLNLNMIAGSGDNILIDFRFDPRAIRRHVVKNYSLDVIGRKHQDYFERLGTVWGDGWYAPHTMNGNRHLCVPVNSQEAPFPRTRDLTSSTPPAFLCRRPSSGAKRGA